MSQCNPSMAAKNMYNIIIIIIIIKWCLAGHWQAFIIFTSILA